MKHNGYGLSVIGKLKESKVRHNLYYEIKDKIVEEVMQNGRPVRVTRKTRCFGTNSDHKTREMLIELLRERMNYHKDKFISPTIYEEMRGLEVKRSGKVEHSELTHDDQVFSYLMALYVWYEGKNLRENYGIVKSGIKTEESIDEEIELTTAYGKADTDITKQIGEVNKPMDASSSKLDSELALMQKSKGVLFSEFINKQRKEEEQHLREMLQDKNTQEAYARYYGVPAESIDPNVSSGIYANQQMALPISAFLDFNKNEDEIDIDSVYNGLDRKNQEQYDMMMAKDDEYH